MELLQLLQQHPHILYIYAVILGLLVGSFLNVVVYRLPRILERQWVADCAELMDLTLMGPVAPHMSLAHPPSHCPHCQHLIRPWENIPLLSYLALRGRCSTCRGPISWRYPLVELACGLVTLVVVMHFGLTWQAAAALLLSWSLLALSLIDYDTQLLPDAITLPFLWLGLLISLADLFITPDAAILGAALGYGTLWGVYQIFRLTTGKEGMGYGDFKLLAMLGAWLGWQSLPQIILLSSCTGAMVGVLLVLMQRLRREQPLPFGPYLAAAGWINLLWGDILNQWYLQWLG